MTPPAAGPPSDSLAAAAPPHELDRLEAQLAALRKRITWLTVAVFLVALALLLTVAAVFGAEIDFHAGESILIAGACTGGVVMGFLFGWLTRRAIER